MVPADMADWDQANVGFATTLQNSVRKRKALARPRQVQANAMHTWHEPIHLLLHLPGTRDMSDATVVTEQRTLNPGCC